MKPIGKDLLSELWFLGARRLLQRLVKLSPDMDPVTWDAVRRLGDRVWDHSARTCAKMMSTAPHVSGLSDDQIREGCRCSHAGYVMRQEDRYEFELFGQEFYREMENRQDELDSHPEYFAARVDTLEELERIFNLCKSVRSETYCTPLGRVPKFD